MPRLRAGEPFMDIGDEAWLRLLAVIHDVDAGIDLAAHDIGHRIAHHGVVRLPFGHQLLQRIGPG